MNILYEKAATGSLDEIGTRLEQAAKNHQFGILNIVDLKAKIISKGVDFVPECRVVEMCNPHRAKEVLERKLSISTVLPCRISLYQEKGKTILSTLLPTRTLGLFEAPDLMSAAQAVESDIKAIMNEAAGT